MREFARRARAEGLVDVAYTETDSPVGRLLLAATRRGLVRVAFERDQRDELLEDLAERLSPRVLEAPSELDDVRRELDEYFEGRRHEFDLPLDWSLTTGDFRRKILERTARIPYGETASYRDVATAAGNERAVRAAGTALGCEPDPDRRSLPPRASHRRRAGRLRRRRGREAVPARPRVGPRSRGLILRTCPIV